jgi:hypothetical protein
MFQVWGRLRRMMSQRRMFEGIVVKGYALREGKYTQYAQRGGKYAEYAH